LIQQFLEGLVESVELAEGRLKGFHFRSKMRENWISAHNPLFQFMPLNIDSMTFLDQSVSLAMIRIQ